MTLLAVFVAATLELVVGEPPERVHPVAWFGQAVAPADRTWSRPRAVGLVVAVIAPLAAACVVAAMVWAAGALDSLVTAVLAGLALFLATSLRMLLDTASLVVGLSDEDLSRAREELPALVGRDPADLTAGQVRSAAVESAAENLADGLVAPLGAFVVAAVLANPLGTAPALAAGAGAAAWVKAVNTLDSMLGYRHKPVGWGPARLDDAVMWLPARASACLLAVASGRPDAVRTARRWQDRVASPNAGWPMGTIATAVGVRLQKPGAYDLDPGDALPGVAESRAAIRTVGVAGALAYAFTTLALALVEVALWS